MPSQLGNLSARLSFRSSSRHGKLESWSAGATACSSSSILGFDVQSFDRLSSSAARLRWPRRGSRVGLGLGKVSATPEHLRRPDADPRAHAALSVEIATVASRAVPRWRHERAPEVLGPHGGARARGSDLRGRTGRPGALPALETRRRLAQKNAPAAPQRFEHKPEFMP